jgi:predicted amidohydrolase
MRRYSSLFLASVLSLVLAAGCKQGDLEPDFGEPPVEDAEPPPPRVDLKIPKKDKGAIVPGVDLGVEEDVGVEPQQDVGTTIKKDAGTTKKDSATTKKDSAVQPSNPDFTSTVGPFPNPVNNKTVAAIQYNAGQASLVKASCTSQPEPDVCALKELAIQARQQNAAIIVFPEDAIQHEDPTGQYIILEDIPSVGDNPGTSPGYSVKTFAKTFSYLAVQLGSYLVYHTWGADTSNGKFYSIQVALGTDGKVLAVHRKFNLFGSESQQLTPGTDVEVFQTPLGTTGLLICADIYGSSALLTKLAKTKGAKVVLISSWYTVDPQSAYQLYVSTYGVYGVFANTTHPQGGYGGYILSPTGSIIKSVKQTTPSVLVGTIPLP